MSESLNRPLYPSPETQVQNVTVWNRDYRWGFNEGQVMLVGAQAPYKTPDRTPPETLTVLVPYLADTKTTFQALWRIAAARNTLRGDRAFPAMINPYDIVTAEPNAPVMSLRWEHIKLDELHGPISDHDPTRGAHAAGLAMAAHAPAWAESLGQPGQPREIILDGYSTMLGQHDATVALQQLQKHGLRYQRVARTSHGLYHQKGTGRTPGQPKMRPGYYIAERISL